MPRALGKIAFIVEEFGTDTPAQQLLDRFLIGYPLNGEFHRPDCEIHLWMPQDANDQEVRRRIADHALRRDNSIESATSQADGIILVPKGISHGGLLSSVLATAPPKSALYFYGAMGDNLEQARQIAGHASTRQVLLLGGTSTSVIWRLPDIDLPRGAYVSDALILVQGEFPVAELLALDGLLPLLERRQGGESGIARVRALVGEDCWKLLSDSDPARDLLAAALSRSDSPLGDPVRDGRTQDLLALGLVPKLATNPRAWIIEYNDGLRSVLMVLDGVIRDFNFAVRTGDGAIISAQLYRPPVPQRHEFSRLAHVIENYFRSRVAPWSVNRSMLTRALLDQFVQLGSKR
jgi:hypothetical protein